jgi:hypothetical protein
MTLNSAIAYGKKLFSIALIFNALVTITFAVGLLSGFYIDNWRSYSPYLIDGNLFWAVIAAGIINIFPATHICKVKTGRLWFHHYVYGFIVLGLSFIFLIFCTSVPLLSLFTTNTTDVAVNVGRFFVLGGLALVLDDLPDVSSGIASFLCKLKSLAHRGRKTIHAVQYLMGFVSLYFFAAVTIWVTQNPEGATLANIIFAGTLLITCLTSFWSVKRKIWHVFHLHKA